MDGHGYAIVEPKLTTFLENRCLAPARAEHCFNSVPGKWRNAAGAGGMHGVIEVVALGMDTLDPGFGVVGQRDGLVLLRNEIYVTDKGELLKS